MKSQLGTTIERNQLDLVDYFADVLGVTRAGLVRRAIHSYINSKANHIELEKEIEKVEELGKKWREASQALLEKCEAERKLAELEDNKREAQVWRSLSHPESS
ncbi:MAG: hypothetical protein CMB30_01910 [Euryarchaeota archaeon]|nr:hypothetical protein [Euryarchaeota archaeon]